MRKITETMAQAFAEGVAKKNGNTVVAVDSVYVEMRLHGNVIAKRKHNERKVQINTCGWQSVTTKERLNGVLGYYGCGYIQQQNWNWYWVQGTEKTAIKSGVWITVR